jgi:hypothetical protein
VVDVPSQVRQLGSQHLQILLSDASPNSSEFAQADEQTLVEVSPHKGLGQAETQVFPLRNFGAVQLVHVVAVPSQVRQLVVSHILQILLSDASPNSLAFAQEEKQTFVEVTPQLGLGQVETHVFPIRKLGSKQLVHVVAVPTQVRHLGEQHLQILLSDASPNSSEFAQADKQTLVEVSPHIGLGQVETQLFPLRNFGALQLVHLVAVPSQVRHLVMSHILQILLSDASPNSLAFAQEEEQSLVEGIPHLGLGQAETQVLMLRKFGVLQLVHLFAVPSQVRQLGSQSLQTL